MAPPPRSRTGPRPRPTFAPIADRWWDRLIAVGAIGSAAATVAWLAESRGAAELVGGMSLAAASGALLAELRARSRPATSVSRDAVRPPPLRSPTPDPSPGRPHLDRQFAASPPPPSVPRPSFSRSDSGWWPVTTTLSHPGDRLWSEWSDPAGPGFPVAVIGPVPETAWVRPTDGGFVPFPAREPDLVIEPSTYSPGPAMPELSEAGLSPVVLEAISPVPVFERIPPTRPRAGPAAAPRRPVGTACASCTDWVVDLRKWSPCPECLRPVCTECLLESMAVAGHGTCATCIVDPRGPATAS